MLAHVDEGLEHRLRSARRTRIGQVHEAQLRNTSALAFGRGLPLERAAAKFDPSKLLLRFLYGGRSLGEEASNRSSPSGLEWLMPKFRHDRPSRRSSSSPAGAGPLP